MPEDDKPDSDYHPCFFQAQLEVEVNNLRRMYDYKALFIQKYNQLQKCKSAEKKYCKICGKWFCPSHESRLDMRSEAFVKEKVSDARESFNRMLGYFKS